MPKRSPELLKGNTPALILSVLKRAPLHGYAIARRIEELSDGYFHLNEGSLYPALHSLESDGHIRASWAVVDGRRRKQYRLTKSGRAHLVQLTKELQRFAKSLDSVMEGTILDASGA